MTSLDLGSSTSERSAVNFSVLPVNSIALPSAGGVIWMASPSIEKAVLSATLTVMLESSADLYIISEPSGPVDPSAGTVMSWMTKGLRLRVTPSLLCSKAEVDTVPMS